MDIDYPDMACFTHTQTRTHTHTHKTGPNHMVGEEEQHWAAVWCSEFLITVKTPIDRIEYISMIINSTTILSTAVSSESHSSQRLLKKT